MHAFTRPGVIGGLVIALALPLLNVIVAFLWANQIVTFDPDGAVVGALQATPCGRPFLGPSGSWWPGDLPAFGAR